MEKFFCEGCVYGKQHKTSVPKTIEPRRTKPGEFIHSNVCRPMSVSSVNDDNSGYRVAYFIKHKSDTFERFKEHINLVVNKFGSPPKYLHVDNGTEYINENLLQYLKSKGIQIETTAPYSPEWESRKRFSDDCGLYPCNAIHQRYRS